MSLPHWALSTKPYAQLAIRILIKSPTVPCIKLYASNPRALGVKLYAELAYAFGYKTIGKIKIGLSLPNLQRALSTKFYAL